METPSSDYFFWRGRGGRCRHHHDGRRDFFRLGHEHLLADLDFFRWRLYDWRKAFKLRGRISNDGRVRRARRNGEAALFRLGELATTIRDLRVRAVLAFEHLERVARDVGIALREIIVHAFEFLREQRLHALLAHFLLRR